MMYRSVAALALYCAYCGRIELHGVSRFAVGRTGLNLSCSCGRQVARVCRDGRGRYCLEGPCVFCGQKHLVLLPANFFAMSGVVRLDMAPHKTEIGYAGATAAVQSRLAEQQAAMKRFLAVQVKQQSGRKHQRGS